MVFGGLTVAYGFAGHLVEHVEFVGNSRAEAAGLRHLVDVRNGTAMGGVDLARVEEGAQRHPWIRSAKAYRRWPDTVVVDVQEYQPVALLQRDGLWYVDADGTVFARGFGRDLDFPVITGIDDELGASHPDLPGLAIRESLTLLNALDAQGLVARDRVSEIAFSRHQGFAVHVRSGARIWFGFDGHEQELGRLRSLVDQGVDLQDRILVDLAPESLAIVRPLDRGGEG